jgi:type II restriction/modification system DNA methylase subunit YeeA
MAELAITEVRRRLQKFAVEHAGDTDEKQHAQQFWRDFYSCFGLSKSSASMFEARVVKLGGKRGYIDSFIPSLLLVEQKSAGKDLDEAYKQAQEYFHAITNEFERPRFIVVCDFARFRLYNLDVSAKDYVECTLEELSKKADWFKFLLDGKKVAVIAEELPINRKAAEQIAKLHEALIDANYKGRDLEVFLTRLLFCLFADDTGIFGEDGIFRALVEGTKDDGSDTGSTLAMLFEVLNTAKDERQNNLDDKYKAFEYVNGSLFAERIKTPYFDFELRKILVSCAVLDWSGISPAIFGAMFQGVLEDSDADTAHRKESRRELGAHYTSERNILKLIKPLFLDGLREEFEKAKGSKAKLKVLYEKLPTLKFIDPACGCGNFLVIAYRELRRVEIDVIAELFFKGEQGGLLDIKTLSNVNLEQFYGIEIDDAAAHIARVAMYITDHQLNLEAAQRFGEARPTVPLVSTPHIHKHNALRVDWNEVLPAAECSYVLGNPPFYGYSLQTKEQKEDMEVVFGHIHGAGVLDYVCAWYAKAARYIDANKLIECAFVSTNSITQGEQPAVLWQDLLAHGIVINFAHRTFSWSNEGKANAAVHCVIVGFAKFDRKEKWLFNYDDIKGDATQLQVKQINAYLVNAANVLLDKRKTPISAQMQVMTRGSSPIDGGNLLLSDAEKNDLINKEPKAERWIKRYLMGDEFINGVDRWCLWLENITATELKAMPIVCERVEAVRRMRLASKKALTVELASRPTMFGEIRLAKSSAYLAIPKVSSERRAYIPIAFLDGNTVCGDKIFFIPNATLSSFGVLTSSMHMAWTRAVCGRMKSDYSYANTIVYNNFPFPQSIGADVEVEIESAAQKILNARAEFPNFSLADLYDPLTMPVNLLKAHQQNNKAVDRAYGYTGADDDASRVAYLFGLYERETNLLANVAVKKRAAKKVS